MKHLTQCIECNYVAAMEQLIGGGLTCFKCYLLNLAVSGYYKC